MATFRDFLLQLRDPALKHRWIAFVDGKSLPENLLVENVTVSFLRAGQKQRFYGGMMNDFPDIAQVDAVQITFYENDQFDTTKYIETWMRKIYDPETEEFGLPVDYVKEIRIGMLPTDEELAFALQLKLERCWPIDRQPADLSYEDTEGRLQVAVTFAVRLTTVLDGNGSVLSTGTN